MNELQFGNKVRQVLDEAAAAGDDTRIRARLQAARAEALVRQRPERSRAGGGVRAYTPRRLGPLLGVSLRVVLPAALLAAGLAGIYSWQQNQHVAAIAELDAKLLAGDLPIDAYIDKGFEAWLKAHASG